MDEHRRQNDSEIPEIKNELRDLTRATTEGLGRLHDDLIAFGADVRRNSENIKDLKATIKDMPVEMAKLEMQVTEVRKDTDDQWGHITTIKDNVRIQSGGKMWNSENIRMLIVLGMTIVIGLLALAGYNVLTTDTHHPQAQHQSRP